MSKTGNQVNGLKIFKALFINSKHLDKDTLVDPCTAARELKALLAYPCLCI